MTVTKTKALNSKQELFRTMLVGILLYSVVLGFFNDYTHILHTGTYSTTFAVAIVMQILTYLTFSLKDRVARRFRGNKAALAFGVWLIMFFSKFVFLGVISVIFRDNVEISGFVGILVVVACLTISQKLVELVDNKLGENSSP